MTIRFDCPSCGRQISVRDENAGKSGICDRCGEKLTVPRRSLPTALSVRPVTTIAAARVATDEVACPMCGELILPIAKKCRHCGEILDSRLRTEAAEPRSQQLPIQITQVVNQSVDTQRRQRWNRGIAMLLSLFIPGLGQFYKGQPVNAVVWFVLVMAGYVTFIAPGLLLHLCCILGAGMGRED